MLNFLIIFNKKLFLLLFVKSKFSCFLGGGVIFYRSKVYNFVLFFLSKANFNAFFFVQIFFLFRHKLFFVLLLSKGHLFILFFGPKLFCSFFYLVRNSVFYAFFQSKAYFFHAFTFMSKAHFLWLFMVKHLKFIHFF